MATLNISYQAEPTARRFHASTADVRGLMGPIGSGKSVACVMEILKRASQQHVGPTGKRKSRWAVIRNTYPELRATTIRTWQDWFPEPVSPFKWDAPITTTLSLGDIECEVIFLSLDKPKDIRKLLSLELTGVWINEAREIDLSVLDMAQGRIRRYPAKRDGGANWYGVIMDTNPPDTDHWWYEKFEIERPLGWECFKQPPALQKFSEEYIPNPAAENIQNHDTGFSYYLKQIPGKTAEWIKVYILGEYGSVMEGKPVFSDYRDAWHYSSDELTIMRGLPIYIGMDFGRTPAAVLGQVTPEGRLQILDELVTPENSDGSSARTFARERLKPLLDSKYAGMQYVGWGDPAGSAKGQAEDIDCFAAMAEEGVNLAPAPTNDPDVRQDAVVKYLTTAIDSGPGFLLAPEVDVLRKGFLGGYQHQRVQVGGERYRDQPAKNRYSHPHDALQYLCCGIRLAGTTQAVRAKPVSVRSAAGWT